MNRQLERSALFKNMYTKLLEPLCKSYGLTIMELNILIFFAENPQYDTAAEIVKIRSFTKSHVSISVRALVERGLLASTQRESDRRNIELHLTELAVPIVEEARKTHEYMMKVLFTGFTKEEKTQLLNMIARIDDNIRGYLDM